MIVTFSVSFSMLFCLLQLIIHSHYNFNLSIAGAPSCSDWIGIRLAVLHKAEGMEVGPQDQDERGKDVVYRQELLRYPALHILTTPTLREGNRWSNSCRECWSLVYIQQYLLWLGCSNYYRDLVLWIHSIRA